MPARVFLPSGSPEGQLSASYDWSVSSVQFKAAQADTFGGPPANSYTDSISPAQPSASSGATLTFTPLIAGYWQVSTSCSVTVTDTTTNQYWSGSSGDPKNLTSYTFNIMYYGVEATPYDGPWNPTITGTTVPVHAGWPIQLVAALSPSDLATNFTWTISGAGGNGSAAINGYLVNNTFQPGSTTKLATSTATAYVLTPSSDTKSTFPDPASSPAMLQDYYYTKAGSFTASVQPQGSSIAAATTTFSVAAPSPSFDAQYMGNTQLTQAGGTATLSLFNAAMNTGISFAHQPVNGTFTSGGTKFEGHSYFVQVYTENDLWTPQLPYDPSYSAVGSGLDTSWPYGNVGTLPNGEVYTDDSPSRSADSYWEFLEVDDSPEMWLMYRPSVAGSIDVPLDSAPWAWGGTATGNGTTWTLKTATPNYAALPQSVPGAGSTSTYPVWAQIIPLPNPPH